MAEPDNSHHLSESRYELQTMTTPLILTQLPSTLENSPFIDAYALLDESDPVSALQSDLEDAFSADDVTLLAGRNQLIKKAMERAISLDFITEEQTPLRRLLAAGAYTGDVRFSNLWLMRLVYSLRVSNNRKGGFYFMLEPSDLGAYIVPFTSPWLAGIHDQREWSTNHWSEYTHRLERLRRRLYEKVRGDL